jgi:hypothetical protein
MTRANMSKLCATFDDQICTCESIVWAYQKDKCDCSEMSPWNDRCMYLDIDDMRCDNLEVCKELNDGHPE